jgi:N-acetylglucosaminyl-diphospho-decaprenol L-rhamnosyltransferase
VIVTYNSADVIESCLEALSKMAPGTTAIVIDNHSVELPKLNVEVIANADNRGFAAAVNQGFRATSSEFVLVLNPDVRVKTPLDDLIAACRQHGIAAGLLTDDAGRPQAGFTVRRLPTAAALAFEVLGLNRLWPSNPVNRQYRCLDLDLSRGGPVEQPAGAFLMIRRDVWRTLNGFDEGFHPVWFEDVDFCKRARDVGVQIEFVPSVRAAHTGGHSVNRVPEPCRIRFWYASLLRYAAKHFKGAPFRLVCLAAALGSAPRMIAGIIKQRSLAPIGIYVGVIGFALRATVRKVC